MFVIVDYGMGNLRSVANALVFLGQKVAFARSPAELQGAQAVILPGVGAFGAAMDNLRSLGLVEALNDQVLERKVPFLGICLGMQLVAKTSEELGVHQGLGWIDGHVRRIRVNKGTRLPHIGWNDVAISGNDPLFARIGDDRNFYFVHSFHVECDPSFVSSTCFYDGIVTASIQKDNIFATQFHPEKSQENGLRLLKSFIDYAGRECVKGERTLC